MTIDIGWLIVCVLAVYYITYVAVYSDLFAPVRNFLARGGFVMSLLSCPHCFSMWAAVLVMVLYWSIQYVSFLGWALVTVALAGASSFMYRLKE